MSLRRPEQGVEGGLSRGRVVGRGRWRCAGGWAGAGRCLRGGGL